MNALTISATRRRKSVVILNVLAIGRSSTKSLRFAKNSSTPISVRLTHALSAAWQRAKSICTPVRIVTFASAAAGLFAFAGFISNNDTLLCTASAATVACIFFLEPMVRKGGEK